MTLRQFTSSQFVMLLLLVPIGLGGCALFVDDTGLAQQIQEKLEKQSQQQWSSELTVRKVVLFQESFGKWKGYAEFANKDSESTEQAKITVTMNWKGEIYYECEPPRRLLALGSVPMLLFLNMLGL